MSQTNGFHSSSLSTSDNDIKHGKKKRSDSNNNSNKKVKHYCHSCGECHGEMISCDHCSAIFHLLCLNPPLTKDQLLKRSYACETCRRVKKTPEKLIQPFSFDPKKNLQFNGLRKIKFPTASNGQSLIQPSGEIKFRAINNNVNKSKQSSANLKRKRMNSSSPPPPPPASNSPNNQLEALHRLFLSCRSEEFHGPSKNSDKYLPTSCFICRKSSTKQGPSIHCDYCPLIYHLDCLTPSLNFLPNEKWMCPNHMTPILDRYLARKTTNDRVKIYQQYSPTEENIIGQDFQPRKIINNHQFERIPIPKAIEEFYISQKSTNEPQLNDTKDQSEETLSPIESSSAYDPSIWDILQAILNAIVNDHPYEFSSLIENNHSRKSSPSRDQMNTLDSLEILLQALNEPNQINDLKQNQILPTFSQLIDLTQFRLSHAVLIHLHSQEVIYIRKHVIWFGSSSSNDICLTDFHSSHACQSITERHACLYYDQKRNLFELLNYSEYGIIVNNLRYGIGPVNDDDDDDLEKCFCCTKSFCHSSWDGPALIEQGTVIKIGCHEFLFYRHIVR